MAKRMVVHVKMNGVFNISLVEAEDMDSIKKEIATKYGDGIFVNGVCVKQGYLSGDQVRNWTRRTNEMLIGGI